MYVWKLNYGNGSYTTTALPGLEDLLSYHGFSIRVTGVTGIRFKSGIDQNLRSQLIGTGVEGYKLAEYGTLSMVATNWDRYSFRKLGRKSVCGRSYWLENGEAQDFIFETLSGRNRFASVLTELPASQYATDFAFRGYMILENGNEKLLIYGPAVSRSMYTVAKQIQAKGEFAVGSSGYQYVQGIIDSVEGK